MPDSPRWCATCDAFGDHHTENHTRHVVTEILPAPKGFTWVRGGWRGQGETRHFVQGHLRRLPRKGKP